MLLLYILITDAVNQVATKLRFVVAGLYQDHKHSIVYTVQEPNR